MSDNARGAPYYPTPSPPLADRLWSRTRAESHY